MVDVYVSPSCSSCRKVKKYFDEHKIEYREINIMVNPITREDIYRILQNSPSGFDGILSTRSNIYQSIGKEVINDMSTIDLVQLIIENPTILKRPIIVSDLDLQVGFNKDDIAVFLPSHIKKLECEKCLNKNTEECYLEAIRKLQ